MEPYQSQPPPEPIPSVPAPPLVPDTSAINAPQPTSPMPEPTPSIPEPANLPLAPIPQVGQVFTPTVNASSPLNNVETPNQSFSNTPINNDITPAIALTSTPTPLTPATPSTPLDFQPTPPVPSLNPALPSSQVTTFHAQEPTTNGKQPTFAMPNQSKNRPGLNKLLLVIVLPLLLIGGAASAAYFGYIVPNKPENIWSSALKNTAKGYDKLTTYATTSKNSKGVKETGSFKLSGPVVADGVLNAQSDGSNGEATGSFSATGLKINFDARTIKSTGDTPDVYFKVDGLQGLGTLLGGGDSTWTNTLNSINGQWYVIDHTFFDQYAKGSNTSLQFNNQDMSALLKSIGTTNRKYLFTGDQKKMAVVVKQNIGKEKLNGKNTYHYKIGFNKANLKAYVSEVCNDFKNSKIGQNLKDSPVITSLSCDNNNDLLNNINESKTADAWVDLHTRLITQIRFTDSASQGNFVDVGQTYAGGDQFPFYLGFQDKTGSITSTGTVKFLLDMKANSLNITGDFSSSGDNAEKGSFNLNIAENNTPVKVVAPTGAKNIIQLFNDLGFGQLFQSAQGNAKDTERQTDIRTLQTQLETYNADVGNYPTLANLNDSAWVSANLKGLDKQALKDPEGSGFTLVTSPTAKAYAYSPTSADGKSCNNTTVKCTNYSLTATLSDGNKFTVNSLGQLQAF